MQKFSKYLSFGTLEVVIVLMMAATVLEKTRGSDLAFSLVYHNPVFMGLWAVVAISGLIYLICRGVPRRLPVFGLHVAFVLILAGALITHLWGESGYLHLRQGTSASAFELEDGTQKSLPFSVSMEQFQIVRYAGSAAPADYSTVVSVKGEKSTISMNNILRYRGYRFCQADYDEDLQGSILAVSHDPWGIGVTYAGYLLLLLSMILFFFVKDTRFRQLVKKLSAAAVVVLGLFAGGEASARKMPGDTPKVLPREVADAFGDLYVYYNDRVCPLSTLSRDYCLKAYGKASWNDYNANQVLTGWLFYYDWWRVVPFKVKAKDKGTPKEAEKDFIQRSVASGDALKLFPLREEDGTLGWYNSNEMLPAAVLDDEALWTFVRKVMDVVEESVRAEDWPEVIRLAGKIRAYQEKTASEVLPPAGKVKAERLWCHLSRPMVPFMASLTLGLLFFVLSGIWLSRGKQAPKALQSVLAGLSLLLWLYLTVTIGLRWYVAGHGPFSGSYNVMMLMAWLAASAMLALYRKFPLIQPLGFILAGFTMLQAAMASANPQITRLMPVLQSPLLSIHVLSMMISYTLLGLMALNGVMGLIIPGKQAKEKLKDVSLLVLYPAVFLLTFGTFLGAVWANISWGSYWAWDPKETWALVTLLVYAFALHGGSLRCMRNAKFFHAYAIIAFICVLITYFGVNLLLGGMHAYA